MILVLLLVAQVATSTASPGQALAMQVQGELEADAYDKAGTIDRFLALPRHEREAFLVEWKKRTELKGKATEVFKSLHVRLGITAIEPVSAPRTAEHAEEQPAARRRSSQRSDPRVVMAKADAELFIAASRKHGYGGALVVTGILGLAGSTASAIAVAVDDGSVVAPVISGAVSLVLVLVGVAFNSSGDELMRQAVAGQQR